eukprot:RCo009029
MIIRTSSHACMSFCFRRGKALGVLAPARERRPFSSHSDPYSVLGLRPGCTPEQLKARYHQLAMACHPDRNNGNDARFKEVQRAYEVLSGPRANEAGWGEQGRAGPSWPPGDDFFRDFGQYHHQQQRQYQQHQDQQFGGEDVFAHFVKDSKGRVHMFVWPRGGGIPDAASAAASAKHAAMLIRTARIFGTVLFVFVFFLLFLLVKVVVWALKQAVSALS